jgi:hypothetical protein
MTLVPRLNRTPKSYSLEVDLSVTASGVHVSRVLKSAAMAFDDLEDGKKIDIPQDVLESITRIVELIAKD